MFSLVITILVLILFVVGIVSLIDNPTKLTQLCVIFGVIIFAGLFYCHLSVEANRESVVLNRFLSGRKSFRMKDILSVDTCYPSAGGLRLCGSGGFFGYWGYFSDIMIGTYFGYYGSRSNCFLIKMKDGKQYVVGCEDAVAMVEYIRSNLAG